MTWGVPSIVISGALLAVGIALLVRRPRMRRRRVRAAVNELVASLDRPPPQVGARAVTLHAAAEERAVANLGR
jgi:hypothetical protein